VQISKLFATEIYDQAVMGSLAFTGIKKFPKKT